MIRQIKCICLLFALVFPSLLLSAQDSVSPDQSPYLDSIRKVLASDYAQQLNRYKALSDREAASNREAIDSLEKIIREMEQEMLELEKSGRDLRSDLGALRRTVEQNKTILSAEMDRFSRLLLVTGPSLLVLILLSTILFFLLIRRQQESTDRKISALKKYTYTEIEETRTDLAEQFRKRVKKLRDKLKGKGGKNKKKAKKEKEKNPVKVKSEKKQA
jgi:hypothetical protein